MNIKNKGALNVISFIVLVIYIIGTLYRNGILYGLALAAISLIVGGITEHFITIAVMTILIDVAYKYINYTLIQKGQINIQKHSSESNNPEHAIEKYISVAGVYDPQIEGFENINNDDDEEEKGGSTKSSSKSTEDSNEEVGVDVDIIDNIKKSSENFQDNSGLFKIGEIPSESKTGPFIDSASTLMKAMNSLDKEQMKSMTDETKKLLESQKSLIGMLENMKPILQDGRQLLDTFSGLFGGGNSKNTGKLSL